MESIYRFSNIIIIDNFSKSYFNGEKGMNDCSRGKEYLVSEEIKVLYIKNF